MWKKVLKVVNACEVAEKIFAIKNSSDELSFAICFEVDSDGTVLESSAGDWWGVKFMSAFDRTFLLFGGFGGGAWYVFDAGSIMTSEELQPITNEMFRHIAANKVCVGVTMWHEEVSA